jgi:hypothetical protein
VIRRLLSILAALGSLLAPASPAAAAQAPASWLLVSDLHFDPLDDPKLTGALLQSPATGWHAILARSGAPVSGYFQDTNFALLESALAQMQARAPEAPVVIVAGDFLAHEFPQRFAAAAPSAGPADYDAFVDKTIAFLAAELNGAFPHAQFVIALGNNDGYCDDYAGTPASPFLAHMAAAFAPLVDRDGRAPDFVRDFSRAGYYTADLPGGQAIVLDSVYWSAKYRNACGVAGSDPGGAELTWLAALPAARPGAFRWFVTHIPPAVDQYSSLRAGSAVPFMQEAAARRLVSLTVAARPAAFIFGHVHHASFEIVGPGDGSGVPGVVVPSISAVQGNDPAFIVADVARATGVVSDLTTYALPLETPGAAWTFEYDFDGAYGTTAFDAADLIALQARLGSDPALWARYARYYNSGSTTAAIVPATWPWYWCGDLELDAAAYGACVSHLLPPAPSSQAR